MARDGIAFFTMTPLIEPWVDSELCDQEDEDPNIHVRRVEIRCSSNSLAWAT